VCFRVVDRRRYDLMNMSLKNMPKLNVHDEPGEFVKVGLGKPETPEAGLQVAHPLVPSCPCADDR
jgi:hypothetical protein